MKLEDSFERALALVHEATLDDTRWLEASRLISEASQSRGSALVFFEGKPRVDARCFFTQLHLDGQLRDDLRDEYFRDCYEHDERVPRVSRLRHGELAYTRDLYTDCEKKTSRTYNELLRRSKAQDGLHTRLDGPDGSVIVWAILDATEPGGWRADQLRTIERFQPHLRQFLTVRQALVEARALRASLTGLLDNRRLGVIHLGRKRRIVAANDRALDVLRRGDELRDRDGFLGARVPAENVELSQLLERALAPSGAQGASGSMIVGRFSARGPLALHVCPVGDEQPSFQALRPAALVLIADPASRPRIDPDMVAAALRLTPAEGRLAAALATGQTLLDVAESTGRMEKTLRWHLKKIFRKQGISRQVDLVKRVLSLEGFRSSPADDG